MAKRFTTHVLKNSDIISRPLPSVLMKGEPIVNTADGIMFFSGVTSSTNGWVPAGTGTTSNYFEVGSNLYNLNLRNKITKYENISGAGLVGKFLSGTTSGFVLANISSIVGIDTYVTGGTYNSGTATFNNNFGGSFTVTGFNTTVDTYVTGFTYNNNNIFTITTSSGSSFSATINQMSGLTVNGIMNASTILSGGTNLSTIINNYDSYATGYTYNPASNTFTISGKNNAPTLNASFNTVSGLSISDLTTNRLVYTNTGGRLVTGTASFDGTNMTLPTTGSLTVGTGGLIIGSGGSPDVAGVGDLVVNGNLTVFGAAFSAFTSQLYVEDNNVILNYNPSSASTASSIGAGLTIQDGNGIANGGINFEIRALNTLTGITSTEIPNITEYTSTTGYANRGFVTQVNDIVIRSNNTSTPNGVRVLAEFDILDGGVY